MMVEGCSRLTQLRQILKIVNFHVRDREMGEVLRKSLLTKCGTDIADQTWDSQKWTTT